MSQRKRELGPAERAVYALVYRSGIDALQAGLYRRQLGALRSHGLVVRREDGSYEAAVQAPPHELAAAPLSAVAPARANGGYHVRLASAPAPTPTPTPPPAPELETEPMVTIVARVPQSVVDVLDAQGEGNRSDAIRKALARGLGSGVRKVAAR